jgi:hypothetical protein
MHEAQMSEKNCFITLTYNDENLPVDNSLLYTDFQKFMKRLRRHYQDGAIRFLVAGEYGEEKNRPHWHAAIFGEDWMNERQPLKKRLGKFTLWRAESLEKLWPFGYSSIGNLTFESAQYIARYVMKKVTGDKAEKHYERINEETGEITKINPEIIHMSLRPGIGKTWYQRFKTDVYPHDRVITNGVPTKPPKYYDQLLKKEDYATYEKLKKARVDRAVAKGDNTQKRLADKETVARARATKLKRELK